MRYFDLKTLHSIALTNNNWYNRTCWCAKFKNVFNYSSYLHGFSKIFRNLKKNNFGRFSNISKDFPKFFSKTSGDFPKLFVLVCVINITLTYGVKIWILFSGVKYWFWSLAALVHKTRKKKLASLLPRVISIISQTGPKRIQTFPIGSPKHTTLDWTVFYTKKGRWIFQSINQSTFSINFISSINFKFTKISRHSICK